MKRVLTLCWVLAAAGGSALDIEPLLARFPADPPEAVFDVYATFNEAPEDALGALVAHDGSATNSAVRYALDGWTTFVLRPGAQAHERAELAAGLIPLAVGTEEPELRRFLLEQVGKVGVRDSVAPTGELLADPEWAQVASLALQSFGLPAYRDEIAAAARPWLDGAEGAHRDVLLQLADPPGGRAWTVALCRDRLQAAADHQVCEALVALYGLVGDDAFPELSAALDHPAPPVRAVALRLLRGSRSGQLVPWLKQRLESEDPQVRAEALALLIDREEPDAAALALNRMEDESALVRGVALRAVPADRLLEAYIPADPRERKALLGALVQRGVPTVADQAHAIAEGSSDPKVQAAMLDVIGKCMAREYMDDALGAVRSPDEGLAAQAVETLKRMAGVEEAGAIVAFMQDADLALSLRSSLVPALVATLNEASDDEGRIAPIRVPLTEADEEVRRMLHRVLAGVHAVEAVRLLETDAGHADASMRDSAIRSLCKWNGFEAAGPLLDVARATTNETHNTLALRRMVQLVKLHQAADKENVERQVDARRRYEAALAVAVREDVKTSIREAQQELAARVEKQEEEADE